MAQKNTRRFFHKKIYDLLWKNKNRLRLENAYGCKLCFVVNPGWENGRVTHPVEIREFMYSPSVVKIMITTETEIKVTSKSTLKPEFRKALEEILKGFGKYPKFSVVFE